MAVLNTAHVVLVLAFLTGRLLNDVGAAPAAKVADNQVAAEQYEDDVEGVDEDTVDPAAVRSKRQINNYSDYYYYPNGIGSTNTNACPFRNFFSSLGLGLNSYYNPGNQYGYINTSGSSSSRSNRRLLRNRQPFLYNGRRGLYAPSRYYSTNRLF